MKIVYLAGPLRGDGSQAAREANVEAAGSIARDVWNAGMVAICPHLNSGSLFGLVSEEMVVQGYLVLIGRCDAVLAMPGWEKSHGAREELLAAMALGVPVYYHIDDLVSALGVVIG